MYDLIVIGAGSAGLAAARRAASHGAKVLLIDHGRVGGTCVNLGCVPKKIMWSAATVREHVQMASHFGTDCASEPFDWPRVTKQRDDYIARLNKIHESNLQRDKVDLVRGTAVLGAKNEVLLAGSEQKFRAANILIATGSSPVWPVDIPGYEHGISSDGFFALQHQPKHVAIVGSGYIAVELAGIFAALGSTATIWCRQDRILTRFDQDIAERLQEEMQRAGKVSIVKRSNVQRVVKDPSGSLTLEYTDKDNRPQTSSGHDCLVWAIGRTAASDSVKAKALGIQFYEQGTFIKVDQWQECSVKGYFAVGDVTGNFMLTPVAIAAGRKLADRLFGGQAEARLEYETIPSVIFSHPPIGTVGLTEGEAVERFGRANVKTFKTQFSSMFYALLPSDQRPSPCLYKLVTVGDDEAIVGLHIIGVAADEMLQGFAVAIKMGAKKTDLDATVAIHPTASEELINMK